MKSLIKKIKDKFSKKENKNIYSLCENPSEDISNYCSLEYTYRKDKNI